MGWNNFYWGIIGRCKGSGTLNGRCTLENNVNYDAVNSSVLSNTNIGGIAGICTQCSLRSCLNYEIVYVMRYAPGGPTFKISGIVTSDNTSVTENCVSAGDIQTNEESSAPVSLVSDDSMLHCYYDAKIIGHIQSRIKQYHRTGWL